MSTTTRLSATADMGSPSDLHFKDAILNQLAEVANIAQFVSFGPDLGQRFSRIKGCTPNQQFSRPEESLAALLAASPERTVNVRSYTPENPKSRRFIYGIRSADAAAVQIRELAAEGLYTIANETIDVNDGGVSGVVFGDLIEFAPGDTPRCVEKPGTASFPRAIGLHVLDTVYGFKPALDFDPHQRVEFSLHPLRRGVRHDHIITWEVERFESCPITPSIRWPNRFSRLVGDKAFGLLVADALGLPVPTTQVISRALPPFRFGRRTATGESWLRTCPKEQVPGKFTTRHGWLDPFRLLAEEDPAADKLASVLAQEGVDAAYSGAAFTELNGRAVIEGVPGWGDEFMQGKAAPVTLPQIVERSVRELWRQATERLGPIRFEWAYDGQQTWILQLHCGSSPTIGDEIYPGSPARHIRFRVSDGLESLRDLVERVRQTGEGIVLVGQVGLSSHMGDVLRRAKIPSRLERG